MISTVAVSILALLAAPAVVQGAASAQKFVAPAACPTCSSPNYIGKSNSTLPAPSKVKGAAFGRFIQIWLENTDFNTAASSSTFQKLAKQGVTLSSYLALTHPSEPNYISAFSGDFWGLADDNFYHVPSNVSTIVDLLERKSVSWATYQENMPSTAYSGNYAQSNYVSGSSSSYTYFVRKHNPAGIHDAVANYTSRASRIRNFNDFGADVNASAIPQWSFITPNLVNDAHDTTIDYASSWLEYFLVPLLNNPKFNSGSGQDGTLIVLTFDENSNYNNRNNVFTLLLGSAVPDALRGTTDDTLFSHYSLLSTVEANWGLDNLGRGDTNTTMSNVFSFVADAVGFTNTQTSQTKEPKTNAYNVVPGPFAPSRWIPFTAPPRNVSRFGGSTYVRPGNDWGKTLASVGKPLALTYATSPSAGTGNIPYPPPNP